MATARNLLLLLGIGALGGCTAEYAYHTAGGQSYPAKPSHCALRVVGMHPGPEYEEIGMLQPDPPVGQLMRDPQELMERVTAEVCRAGGEVVATQVNGDGLIVRAAVLRKRTGTEPASAPLAAAQPASTAVAQPVAPGECEPICSPGFACRRGVCVPQCNPGCEHDETCGRDRLCHAKVP